MCSDVNTISCDLIDVVLACAVQGFEGQMRLLFHHYAGRRLLSSLIVRGKKQ